MLDAPKDVDQLYEKVVEQNLENLESQLKKEEDKEPENPLLDKPLSI